MNRTTKYDVIFQGIKIYTVSEQLVKQNNLDDYDLHTLKQLFIARYLIDLGLKNCNDYTKIHSLYRKFIEVEAHFKQLIPNNL